MELKPVTETSGFLKAGFMGFQGSGKTFTAERLAVGTRAHFGLKGPIAMFDTEGGAQYIARRIKAETKKDLLAVQSRALADVLEFIETCAKQGVSVAIIDSVTHIWKKLCDDYLEQVNAQRQKRGRSKLARLSFQDWGVIKGKWAAFSDAYLNSPLHVIICGRAGFEWDYQEINENKELVKTGFKMKAEGEFGYEPSLLVWMERLDERDDDGKLTKQVTRRATVLKDRFDTVDGKHFDNPTFDFFKPHVALLTPGSHQPIDTEASTDMGVTEEGDGETREQWDKKRRQILCEEIQGVFQSEIPGQAAADKKAKADVLQAVFGTRSWTAVESLSVSDLKNGLTNLHVAIAMAKAKPEEAPKKVAKKGKKAEVKA